MIYLLIESSNLDILDGSVSNHRSFGAFAVNREHKRGTIFLFDGKGGTKTAYLNLTGC